MLQVVLEVVQEDLQVLEPVILLQCLLLKVIMAEVLVLNQIIVVEVVEQEP
tara:strand:+ start:191 stop:343 length:153 start_codon:yes stop_codon:yes gene_type:complete